MQLLDHQNQKRIDLMLLRKSKSSHRHRKGSRLSRHKYSASSSQRIRFMFQITTNTRNYQNTYVTLDVRPMISGISLGCFPRKADECCRHSTRHQVLTARLLRFSSSREPHFDRRCGCQIKNDGWRKKKKSSSRKSTVRGKGSQQRRRLDGR